MSSYRERDCVCQPYLQHQVGTMSAAPLCSFSRVTLERTLIQTLIKSTKTSPYRLLVFLNIPDYMCLPAPKISLSQHCHPKSTPGTLCSLDHLLCTSTFLPPVLAKHLRSLMMSVITKVKKDNSALTQVH